MTDERKDATAATVASNRELLTRLPFAERPDFDDAAQGLVAPLPDHGVEQLRAVFAAENCCHTLRNTYTLRGAPIRDPQAWSTSH